MEWLPRQLRTWIKPGTLVLLVGLAVSLPWIQSRVERREALPPKPAAAPPAAVAAPAPAVRRAQLDAVGAGWGEDPFARRFSAAGEEGKPRVAPPSRKEGGRVPAPGLYLQGVMTGPLGRTALINGSVVREGERIGTREVLQIGRRSVVLLENGAVVTLFLQGETR